MILYFESFLMQHGFIINLNQLLSPKTQATHAPDSYRMHIKIREHIYIHKHLSIIPTNEILSLYQYNKILYQPQIRRRGPPDLHASTSPRPLPRPPAPLHCWRRLTGRLRGPSNRRWSHSRCTRRGTSSVEARRVASFWNAVEGYPVAPLGHVRASSAAQVGHVWKGCVAEIR